MPNHPSGAQYEITYGEQRAVVTEVGATLRSYECGGRAVLDGYAAEEMNRGSRGALLAPWPNRTANGRWHETQGEEHQLPVNEPRTGSALHGLVSWLCWRVRESHGRALTLECTLPAQPGYPFTLHLQARYALDDSGLACSVTATNRGSGDAPYGIGHHPYIACPEGVDAAELRVPARQTLELDSRGIPTGAVRDVAGTPYDFRAARRVGAVQLDTCYAALQADADGRVRASVDGVTVWMEAPFAWLMVYSGDTLEPRRRRRGLAVEPMTCPPDALNSRQGIAVLAPGAQLTTTWGISPASVRAGRVLPS